MTARNTSLGPPSPSVRRLAVDLGIAFQERQTPDAEDFSVQHEPGRRMENLREWQKRDCVLDVKIERWNGYTVGERLYLQDGVLVYI